MTNKNRLRGLICLLMIFALSCNTQVENKSPEEQIVSFVLDSIIQVNSLQGTILIVYGPAITTSADVIVVDKDHPYHVWWSEDGKLLDKGNTSTAVKDFYKLPDTQWEIGFSIISIDASTNEAEVYIEEFCGTTCGVGTQYIIHLNESNQWEIKDEEELWVS